jgi:hypothetical protein
VNARHRPEGDPDSPGGPVGTRLGALSVYILLLALAACVVFIAVKALDLM